MSELDELQKLSDQMLSYVERFQSEGNYEEIKRILEKCDNIRRASREIDELCILSEINDIEKNVGRTGIWKTNESLHVLLARLRGIIELLGRVSENRDFDAAKEIAGMIDKGEISMEGVESLSLKLLPNPDETVSLVWNSLKEIAYSHELDKGPLVSILITCYNHENYIGEAIDSVMNQTYKNIQVIVTDDGSTDKSREVIRDRINKWGEEHFIFISYEENTCFACIEEAYEKATGKYICTLGGDDKIEPTRTAIQVDFLEKNQDIYKACFTWVKCIGNMSKAPGFEALFNKVSLPQDRMIKVLLHHNYLNAPSVMMRREIWNELGGYDYAYRQLQDYDLWLRFCARYKAYVIPDKLTVYRIVDGSLSDTGASPKAAARLAVECTNIISDLFETFPSDSFVELFFPDCEEELTELDIMCLKLKVLWEKAEVGTWMGDAFEQLFFRYRKEKGLVRLLDKKYGISRKAIQDRWLDITSTGYVVSLSMTLSPYQEANKHHRLDFDHIDISNAELINEIDDKLKDSSNSEKRNKAITCDHIIALYDECKDRPDKAEMFENYIHRIIEGKIELQ